MPWRAPLGWIIGRVAAIALVLATPSRYWGALRVLALFGFIAILLFFPLASPRLRNQVVTGIYRVARPANDYALYIYSGCALALLCALLVFVRRALRGKV